MASHTRELFIKEFFIDIELNPKYVDLYYVRKSILEAVKSSLPKFHGDLLDVGCGIMPYRELIRDSNKKVTSYVGLDFENAIEEEYALGKPDLFWKGDVIPMPDNSVDTVMATEFFEHCPYPDKIMLEVLRVLKPNGVLFFTVPFLWPLHSVPYDEYRYTPFALERLLKDSGFHGIEMKALGGMDASLAQMMSIWYQHRALNPFPKKYIGKLFIPIIKRLINADRKVDKTKLFNSCSMITGITGLAYK